jgi:hypothetical protein
MIEPKVMEFSEGEYVLHSDYARLKAEVDRLTKAGDKMAEPLEKGEMRTIGYFLAMDWNAAKEGKQS